MPALTLRRNDVDWLRVFAVYLLFVFHIAMVFNPAPFYHIRNADLSFVMLIVAGASALDPLDPVFGGLTLLGARMERHGAPAHPGSLLWLARWHDLPVLGMPTCGMFSQATTFDLVLPRLLAGEDVDNQAIAALGHGGLLSREMAYRFPPYRADVVRGELE